MYSMYFDSDPSRMLKKYILDDDKNIVEVDFMTWAQWFEHGENRIIKQEGVNDYWISTIFSGITVCELFETMVFADRDSDPLAYYKVRSSTYQDALRTHAQVIGLVLAEIALNAPELSKMEVRSSGKLTEPKSARMIRRLKSFKPKL